MKNLIKFDSQTINFGADGKEFEIQKYIKKKLKEIGADIVDTFEPNNSNLIKYGFNFIKGHEYVKRPNVVGVFNLGKPGKTVLLNGHVDTVAPAGGKESWSFDPWEPVIKNDRLYGLGTTDMKCGLGNLILCVEFLKELKILKKGSIIIESVVDEEGSGNGTLACIDKGYNADIGIIAEPTNLEIHVANRGVQILEMIVNGLSVHASVKWEGVNAIEKSIEIIKGLEKLEKKWLTLKNPNYVPRPTISVTEISSGMGATTIPNKCVLRFDIKFTYCDLDEKFSPENVRREIEDWINMVCNGDSWLCKNKPIIKWCESVSAYENKAIYLFDEFVNSCIKILGHSKISGSPAGSDARLLGNISKIPTILFGPGRLGPGGPHSVDENVSIDQIINHLKILCLSVYSFISETN